MKAYGGVDEQIQIFLTSALVGGEWSASRPHPLYPRKKCPWYPLDRRLDGPQRCSGRRGEVKILDPTGTQNSDPSVDQPIARRYTDCDIPAPLGCLGF
jgi:hypothetical protein